MSDKRTSLPIAGDPEPPEFLLTRGNRKVGEDIHTFSVPAPDTCPGRSRTCSARCYALRLYVRRPSVLARHQQNLEALADLDEFRERMLAEIRCRCVRVIRWHVAGDVYGAEYASALLAVMTQTPKVSHFLYTRSWRVPALCPWLARMAELPNVAVWYSLDATTGVPRSVPPGVRLCWLAASSGEAERFAERLARCDLVFLDHHLRRLRLRTFGGVHACPQERDPDISCSSCRFCLPG